MHSFSLGFSFGVLLCVIAFLVEMLLSGALEARRRVQRARLNAQRLEQQRFFTQWPERSL